MIIKKHSEKTKQSKQPITNNETSLTTQQDLSIELTEVMATEETQINNSDEPIPIVITKSKDGNTPSSESDIIIDTEAGLHTPAQMRFCKHFLKRLDELIWVHSRSAEFYEKLHHRILTPSILITGTSGVVSFLSTSTTVSTNSQQYLGIVVGIMASISTITQSLMGAFAFQAKSEAHRLAAEEYCQLQVKVHFELAMPNEPDFMETLESKLLEIKNKCKYFPPQSIVDKYHQLDK